MILSLAQRPRLGSWIGDTIQKLDNLGTQVCPAVATVVGSAYGVPVGAVGGALPTICQYSRLVDPTHWLSVGGEKVFGTSSPGSSLVPLSDADAAALQLQSEHSRNMLLIFAGLAGAGVVGYLALRHPTA